MNFAVLVDLNSVRLDFDVFNTALDELKRRYDASVVFSKFYSYNSKRYADFNNYIKKEGSEVALALQNRKKVKIDIRQVIDGVGLACMDTHIDGFFIICSKIDSIHFLQALKSKNKFVVLGLEYGASFPEFCDGFITIKPSIESKTLTGIACEEINADIKSGINSSQKIEELPFKVVDGAKEEMEAIQFGLSSLINKKFNTKKMLSTTKELETLIKKYF